MQAEPIADGEQPMTSADVVFKVLCLSQDKPPPRQVAKTLFWRKLVSWQAPPK
jgi:hypothetical protein